MTEHKVADQLLDLVAPKTLRAIEPKKRVRFYAVALAMEAGKFAPGSIRQWLKEQYELDISPKEISQIRRNPLFHQLLQEAILRYSVETRLLVARLIFEALSHVLTQVEQNPDAIKLKDALMLLRYVDQTSVIDHMKLIEALNKLAEGGGHETKDADTVVRIVPAERLMQQ